VLQTLDCNPTLEQRFIADNQETFHMTTPLLEERKRLLADRLVTIRKLADRLAWSNKRVRFPLHGPALRTMDEARAESPSAFIERFSKLQELLGATFREVASLSGQPADDYNLVLSTMEKAGITNADEWRELRALRNEVAHEYSLGRAAGRPFQLARGSLGRDPFSGRTTCALQ